MNLETTFQCADFFPIKLSYPSPGLSLDCLARKAMKLRFYVCYVRAKEIKKKNNTLSILKNIKRKKERECTMTNKNKLLNFEQNKCIYVSLGEGKERWRNRSPLDSCIDTLMMGVIG